MELDPRIVRPREAMHAEIGPQEALRRRALLLGIRDGEDPEGAVCQEDQLATGAQEACGLGDPAVRIGPNRCPVLADCEVEACIGQSGRLGVAVDEREVEVVLVLGERAVLSCSTELSMPVGRAPRRASQADTYAVPQPSSMTSMLTTSSGRALSSVSGMPKMPQVISFVAHERRPDST